MRLVGTTWGGVLRSLDDGCAELLGAVDQWFVIGVGRDFENEVPILAGLEVGDHFCDEVWAWRFPPGRDGFLFGPEWFVPLVFEADVVFPIEKEGHGHGCSADFLII